jgi:glycosyltransferase involved in cell wall biosynthesis
MTSVANRDQVISQEAAPSFWASKVAVESERIPRVSVVIPAYNSAPSLRGAIQSVLDQTYRDSEILVIDDGSTDDTECVVRSFGDRVCYLKQENRGVSAARNHGIKVSRAPYVAFLDSDDLWLPGKLAEQIPLLDRDPEVGLVYSDWAVVSEENVLEPSYLSNLHAGSGYVFNELLQSGFILTSGTVVRRSCLDEVGDFDEALSITQDYDLWLRICYRWKIALVNKPLLIKKSRDGSLSSNLLKTATERIALFEKVLRTFPDMTPRSRRLVKHQLAINYWDVGYDHYDRMLFKEARKNFASSLAYDWRNGRALLYLAASYLPSSLARVARAAKRAIL